jgi:glutamate synthase (NADPH) small chain
MVEMDKYGGVVTNADLSTKTPGVFAAGDIVLGPSSIIESVGQAKKAAATLHKFLSKPEGAAPPDASSPVPI